MPMVDPMPMVNPIPMVDPMPMVDSIYVLDPILSSFYHCLCRRSIEPFPLVFSRNVYDNFLWRCSTKRKDCADTELLKKNFDVLTNLLFVVS